MAALIPCRPRWLAPALALVALLVVAPGALAAAPATTVDLHGYTPGTWTNAGTVTADFSVTSDAGAATTYYAIDDVTCSPADTTSCSVGATVEVSGDAAHELTFFSSNDDGFEEAQSVSIDIDTIAPDVFCPESTDAPFLIVLLRADDPTLTPTIADGLSGPTTPTAYPIDAKPLGIHELEVSGSDVAGNTTVVTCTYVVQPQFVRFRPQTGDRFSRQAAITLSFKLTDAKGKPLADSKAKNLARAGLVRFGLNFDVRSQRFSYGAGTNTFSLRLPPRTLARGDQEVAAVLLDPAFGNNVYAFADAVIRVTA